MIKYLLNHNPKKAIAKNTSCESVGNKLICSMKYLDSVSENDIEVYNNFKKQNGMFISYDSDKRILKYKIGSHD